MSDLKRTLYAFHGRPSSNTIKTAILLEELGLGYEISSLSVCHPTYENDAVALTLCFQRDNGDQKSAEHTKRHPNSKVPVLHNVNRVMTWESLAISLHLIKEYDKNLLFSRPCVHFLLGKREVPELQHGRPFFRSEVLRLLGILDSYLVESKFGYISPHGYSFVDAGWVVYSDHNVQKGIGFELDEFPHVKDWHERI